MVVGSSARRTTFVIENMYVGESKPSYIENSISNLNIYTQGKINSRIVIGSSARRTPFVSGNMYVVESKSGFHFLNTSINGY